FSGGQVGAQVNWTGGRWGVNASAKVALGATSQTVRIDGSTTLFPDATLTNGVIVPGGFHALATNIGVYRRNQFAVAPECALNLIYQLTSYLGLEAGYSFLYLSNVARPGDQIDFSVSDAR